MAVVESDSQTRNNFPVASKSNDSAILKSNRRAGVIQLVECQLLPADLIPQ